MVLFFGIFAGVIFAVVRFGLPGITAYANYKAKFKQDVVSEIFKIACPGAEYAPEHGIAKDVFIGCGIFQDRGSYSTDDRVRGRIGQTPFEAAEVKRRYSTGSGKNSRTLHRVPRTVLSSRLQQVAVGGHVRHSPRPRSRTRLAIETA